MPSLHHSIGRFRIVAFLEGVSNVALFFIAMPLKYLADMPQAVKYTGWIHGILFLVYLIALAHVWLAKKWVFWKVVVSFMASLLPFGTFFLDARLLKEEELQIQE